MKFESILGKYVTGVKFNVGCGPERMEGWVNVDLHSKCDLRFDIRQPWPIRDGSIDTVYASHILEHFDGDELHDIFWHIGTALRPGGRLLAVVPYALSSLQVGCPQHKQGFLERTPEKFSNDSHADSEMGQGFRRKAWDVEEIAVERTPYWKTKSQEELEFARIHFWNVFREMCFVMKLKE